MEHITNSFGSESQQNTTEQRCYKCLDSIFELLINSDIVNSLVFKGGYILKSKTKESRATSDIDLSLDSYNSFLNILSTLKLISENLISKGYIDKYIIQDNLQLGKSARIRFIHNQATLCHIDISIHDISYGTTSLIINDNSISVFSLERMMADKLSVLFSDTRYRRAKDLYDVYQILSTCNLNGDTLRYCIQARNIDFSNSPFTEANLKKLEHAYNKLNIKEYNTLNILTKPLFTDILEKLGRFLTYDINTCEEWCCNVQRWR